LKFGADVSDAALLTGEVSVALEHESYTTVSLDGKRLRDKKIRKSHFVEIGLKETILTDCDFNHSTFENCYFRKTSFRHVSFVGCTFKDCKFDGAIFSECHFDHAEFFNCSIGFEQFSSVLENHQYNARWRLARNLRMNSQNRGAYDDARLFLLAELRASEAHNYNKAFNWRDSYYRTKYRWEDRLRGMFAWTAPKISNICWGHGEKPVRVIIIAVVVATLFAYGYWRYDLQLSNAPADFGFGEYLGFSAATFITATYGNLSAVSRSGRIFTTIESIVGFAIFGLFVATLYRRVSKR